MGFTMQRSGAEPEQMSASSQRQEPTNTMERFSSSAETDFLNANDFFLNRPRQQRPALKQNQAGLAVGGPIRTDMLLVFGSSRCMCFQDASVRPGAAG
jgi:hypothetical protein